MSKRTSDLPPLTGLPGLVREWRYHEFSRQALGLLLMPLYAVLARPDRAGFWIGAALAVAGLAVRLFASGFIVKNRELATDGPYALVRHPLYTGNLLVLVGFTFASGLWWALALSALFWFFFYPPAVEYEDRKLRARFGDEWEAWSGDVPAVIPRRLTTAAAGRWSLEKSWGQNYEFLVVGYSLVWLFVIGLKLG